jgi:hypothetical protein
VPDFTQCLLTSKIQVVFEPKMLSKSQSIKSRQKLPPFVKGGFNDPIGILTTPSPKTELKTPTAKQLDRAMEHVGPNSSMI